MLKTPDHTDALSSPPAFAPAGTPGFYADCDPASGKAGTVLRAEDFNELILNLRQLMSSAAVTGTKGAPTILEQTLDRLYSGTAHSVVATQTLSPDFAGLVTVDATAADVTLTLPSAAACPGGSQTFIFVRLDTTTRVVKIIPAAGQAIRLGVLRLTTDPIIVRSDGVNTWHSLLPAWTIVQNTTLQVSTTGIAQPVDPAGGDPFDSLASAYAWIARRTIASGVTVTVQIAAGTYTRTTPITFNYPYISQVKVVGAGSASTILVFNGTPGLNGLTGLPSIEKLTIRGTGTQPQCDGLILRAGTGLIVDDVVIEGFTQSGCALDAILTVTTHLTIQNCTSSGMSISPGGQCVGGLARVDLNNNGAGAVANLYLNGGSVYLKTLATLGGPRGVLASGRTASGNIENLNVVDPTVTAEAVRVEYGALLQARTPGASWYALNTAGTVFYVFLATQFGQMATLNCLSAGNRANTSPPVNTRGNVQSYIQAT